LVPASNSALGVHESPQENTNSHDRNVKRYGIELSDTQDQRAIDPARTQMGATPGAREGARSRFSCIFGNRLCTRAGRDRERGEASQNDAERNHING
jgi:hypothetical protein